MARVILKNISKVFEGDVKAVSDVNLDVGDKEFVILVGPSGCGKSTTLRMIAGLEEISSGELIIDEDKVNDLPPKDRNIAMVFQNYALYPHMTVYKNMAFGLKLRKMKHEIIDERVNEAASILGITELLDRKPKALSGGQRQRVAVGRAIVRKPKVFLFDEPLSNLDAKLRVQMRAEISKLHTRLQSTMIYVTHDQTEAMTMGDRIVVLKDGLVQQIADPLTLYNKPVNKFVAGFMGSPPMNFMEVTILKEGNTIIIDEGSHQLKIPGGTLQSLEAYIGKKVVLGVRPEDIIEKTPDSPSEFGSITATVEVVEPLGSEIYVYLSTSVHTLIAKIPSDHDIKVNESFEVLFDMDKIHLFDYDTELAIL
ncbi:MAG: sn-glycerol-3-phosphate ABC transporter ATP-binding protein UgpC [Spirochaetes bacterium]|nr:sn-glycerol-3-phosphate ABC transporter ATP-binding protein UgpC [Spirochaetota bacterium]